MNDSENYKDIVENIFGKDACNIDVGKSTTNSVIGALNHTQFGAFTTSYKTRLERLSKLYSSHTNFKDLVNTVNQVADEKNWEGAYAEIVAYDYLNSDNNWLSEPIFLEKTVPASETIADNLGYQNANFDGEYKDFNICFDIKILSDKTGTILTGIFKDVQKRIGRSNFSISPEYPLDIDYEVFQKNRKKLFDELVSFLSCDQEPLSIKSRVIPELRYGILWGAGVLMTESSYHPYLHAKNHHNLLFKHAKKFSKVKPSLIIFVVFPWFSEKISDLGRANEIFYRSFSRRFFCQYAGKPKKAKDIFKNYSGEDSVFDVTKKLSGVLFLEDKSIMANTPTIQNVEGYAYLNPNADKKIGRGIFIDYLHSLQFHIDDFEYDNY